MTQHASALVKTALAISLMLSQHIALAHKPQEHQEPLPPDLELVDEIDQPTVTIRKPEESGQIIERKESGGVVKEIKVQTGVSTYYLYPTNPAGSGMREDNVRAPVKPALWRVHEFDLGESKPEEKEERVRQPDGQEAPPPAIKGK